MSIVDCRLSIENFNNQQLTTTNRNNSEIRNLQSDIAAHLATLKVKNPISPQLNDQPLYGEIEFEKKRLLNPDITPRGILYSGFHLSELFGKLLRKNEVISKYCHITITDMLIGTWDEQNMKWHARTSIYNFPSIISYSGIVEAPAKPKNFYLKRQLGMPIETLKQDFRGQFIDYDDDRLPEVIKGYLLQSIFFYITGYPFCEDRNCRLFNAHWQTDLIYSQLETPSELCDNHLKILLELKQDKQSCALRLQNL